MQPHASSPARSVVPALVGGAAVVLAVAVGGLEWVRDQIDGSEQFWAGAITYPLGWSLTPDGAPTDVWLAQNVVPVTWPIFSALALWAATWRRDRWSPMSTFFAAWGALVGAGVAAGVVQWLYWQVVDPYDGFNPLAPAGGVLNEFYGAVDVVMGSAVTIGFWVALLVALVTVVMGTGDTPGAPPLEGPPPTWAPEPTAVQPAAHPAPSPAAQPSEWNQPTVATPQTPQSPQAPPPSSAPPGPGWQSPTTPPAG